MVSQEDGSVNEITNETFSENLDEPFFRRIIECREVTVMTLRELSKLTNVSVSTISKAFHDADDVSEETRRLVFDTAKRTGCFGKYYKGRYSKKIIAIICPEMNGTFYTGYIERLQAIIERNDAIALISADHFSAAKQSELIDYYASFLHVDGILVLGLKAPLKKGYEIPVVSLLGGRDCCTDSVYVDIAPPMQAAVSHLMKLGHRKIAFIGEKLTEGKAQCFQNAMRQHKTEPFRIVTSGFRFEQAGEDCVRELLREPSMPTALICAYDDIAFGAIKQLTKSGYSVPNDISVIGIDNINVSAYMERSLTSIDTYPDEICAIVWDLLQKKMENRFSTLNQCIVVSGRLIVRDTTAPARV